jgi:hypothetical protein
MIPYTPPQPEVQAVAVVDPSLIGGNRQTREVDIYHQTIESAQASVKELPDPFVTACIADKMPIGKEVMGIKGFLDKVKTTPEDEAIISDPERIAGLYLSTTDMITRNLKINLIRKASEPADPARIQKIKDAKQAFIDRLRDQSQVTADQMVAFCEKRGIWPSSAAEYHGFTIDGNDVIDNDSTAQVDYRPNIKIQRQFAETFIMGYSDKRVAEKVRGTAQELPKRIYLNPDPEAVPLIFEHLLQTANDKNMSLQLKMLQRSSELASVHRRRLGNRPKESVRGDGMVIYANEADAQGILEMVLKLAKDNPDAFKGRQTSRVPTPVAEGIAVGDEPVLPNGGSESLTSHRSKILEHAATKTRGSGLSGAAALDLFRSTVNKIATLNGVNPNNIAFNAAPSSARLVTNQPPKPPAKQSGIDPYERERLRVRVPINQRGRSSWPSRERY